jgi:hypothetical protein
MSGAMEKTYSSSEIQRIAKITKMQAIHWTQTGIITPLEDAEGRGSKRVYSWGNLIEMMICRELNRYKIERPVMKSAIRLLNTPANIDEPPPRYESYWQFFKQNPDTEISFLVISLSSVNKFWQGDLKGWLRELIDQPNIGSMLKEYGNVFSSKNGVEKDGKYWKTPIIVKKERLELLSQVFKSCVVINIGSLISEGL